MGDKMKLKDITEIPAPTDRKGVMKLLGTVTCELFILSSYLTCHTLLSQTDFY